MLWRWQDSSLVGSEKPPRLQAIRPQRTKFFAASGTQRIDLAAGPRHDILLVRDGGSSACIICQDESSIDIMYDDPFERPVIRPATP